MPAPTFETKARRRAVNASRLAEVALTQVVRESEVDLLCAEIGQDMVVLADYVAAHGDPAAELREMFDRFDCHPSR